jgi:flagella basal body P-ring formation protein FlgA
MKGLFTARAILVAASLGVAGPAVAGDTVEAHIARELSAQVRARLVLADDARVEVRDLRAANPRAAKLARSVASVQIPPGAHVGNTVTALVELTGAAGKVESCWYSAAVSVELPCWRAARSIATGAVIGATDVEQTFCATSNQRAERRLDAIVGKRSRRPLTAEETIFTDALEVLPLVDRGSEVAVVVAGPGFTLRTRGAVMERGGAGELVRVKVAATGKVIAGTVRDAQTVIVDAATPGEPPTH